MLRMMYKQKNVNIFNFSIGFIKQGKLEKYIMLE